MSQDKAKTQPSSAETESSQVREESREDIRNILKNLYAIEKQQEFTDKERAEIASQLDRLDRWTHRLADDIGYEL